MYYTQFVNRIVDYVLIMSYLQSIVVVVIVRQPKLSYLIFVFGDWEDIIKKHGEEGKDEISYR